MEGPGEEKWAAAAGRADEKRSGGARQLAEKPARRRSWSDALGVAVCAALSLLCVGACAVILARTSDLQSRLLRLEQRHWDAKLSAWMQSVEQVEPVILERLDRILEEVRRHRAPLGRTWSTWQIGQPMIKTETRRLMSVVEIESG